MKTVAINSLLHFLVDGICACCVFQMLSDFDIADSVALILTYNILAFMTQPFTGWMADRLHGNRNILTAAVALLVAAVAISSTAFSLPTGEGWGGAFQFVVAVLLGLGNSLFHVWGGRTVATVTGNDIRALGIFVSTGAAGLTSGILFHSWPLLIVYVVTICVVSSIPIPTTPSPTGDLINCKLSNCKLAGAFLFLLMLVVMFRSFLGEAFGMGIEKDTPLILVISATVLAGKMSGGWIARHFGIVRSMAVVVVGVIICSLLRQSSLVAFLLGLYLINTTMPVTLYLANVLLPNRYGLAFGLLASVLVPGFLLATLLIS